MLTTLLVGFVSSYPEFALFMTAMGLMRSINKPLFSLVQKIVDTTETKMDNEMWKKVKDHRGMKSFLWLLDFTASIKIPK